MTSRDFCYWLQGHFEISDSKSLNERETAMVKRHLAMVFKHEIDPSFDNAEELRGIHTPAPEGLREALEKQEKEKKYKKRRPEEHYDRDRPIMC